MTSTLELRTITDGEIEEFRAALMTTFGDDADDADPNGAGRFRALIPPGRAWVVRDGGQVVATAASFTHELVIPGGTMAMAGLTMVTVRPTHRRRGLLRRLVDRHLADARDHGEAVSGLWASEAAIYGRFGYGVATFVDALEADLGGLEVAAGRELDAVTWLDEPGARVALPPIYARATADRPGAFVRSDAWWRERRFLEAPFSRAGASRRRHVAARRGDELTGYVAFRQRSKWDDAVAAGTVEVLELVAQDARAEATLWRFLAGIDLFPRVSWGLAPVDGLLPWLIADARRVRRRRSDGMWLRLDDVAVALAARAYADDGALVLDVEGTRVRLEAAGGVAACAPSTATADLTVDRAGLGSLFLGAVTATTLARAGRAHGRAAAVARADRLFAWPVDAWCPEVF